MSSEDIEDEIVYLAYDQNTGMDIVEFVTHDREAVRDWADGFPGRSFEDRTIVGEDFIDELYVGTGQDESCRDVDKV